MTVADAPIARARAEVTKDFMMRMSRGRERESERVTGQEKERAGVGPRRRE